MKIQFLLVVLTIVCTFNSAHSKENLLSESMDKVSETFKAKYGEKANFKNDVLIVTDEDYCRDYSSSIFNNTKCKLQVHSKNRYNIKSWKARYALFAKGEEVTCYQAQAKEFFKALSGMELQPVIDRKESIQLYLHTLRPYQGNSEKFLADVFYSGNLESEMKKYPRSEFSDYCRSQDLYCVEASYSLTTKECKIKTADEIIERSERLIQEAEVKKLEEQEKSKKGEQIIDDFSNDLNNIIK